MRYLNRRLYINDGSCDLAINYKRCITAAAFDWWIRSREPLSASRGYAGAGGNGFITVLIRLVSNTGFRSCQLVMFSITALLDGFN